MNLNLFLANKECDEGWTLNADTNKCYKFFNTEDDSIPWLDARSTCKHHMESISLLRRAFKKKSAYFGTLGKLALPHPPYKDFRTW